MGIKVYMFCAVIIKFPRYIINQLTYDMDQYNRELLKYVKDIVWN